MTATTVLSPCIGVCIIHAESGYCHGCLRTLGEIAAWAELDDRRRLEVIAALPERASLVPPHP